LTNSNTLCDEPFIPRKAEGLENAKNP